MLHVHRAERADRLVDGLGEVLREPPARPVHARGRRGSGQGRRAVAHAAAVPRARPSTGGQTACAPTSVPVARRRWSPTPWPCRWYRARRRPVEPRPVGLAAARGHRRVRAEDVVRDARATSRHRRRRVDQRTRPAAAPPPATWPRCSTATAPTARRCSRAWAAGDDADGGPLRRPALAGRAVAAAARAGSACRARPSGSTPPAQRLRDRAGPGRPAGPAVGVRAHPADPAQLEVARRARRAPRRPPVAAPPLPRAVGAGRRRRRIRARSRRRDDQTADVPRQPAAGAASAATSASCSSGSPPERRPSSTITIRSPSARHPARPAAARPCRRRDPVSPASRSARPTDRSVQVHACHGRARQVEVLREVLLGLLRGRPDARAARRARHVPGRRGRSRR